MQAFWWYKENSIAGMARPGFNKSKFYNFDFEEMTVLGWLGRYSCGEISLRELSSHFETYMPRVFSLIKMDQSEGQAKIAHLLDPKNLSNVVGRLQKKTGFVENFSIENEILKLKMNFRYLDREIETLKANQISTIVALTEEHHQRDQLAQHFDLHHISIPDMHAPTFAQAAQLAKILIQAEKTRSKVAVHCLAGIGRTSTMIMAAQMILGDSLESVRSEIKAKNPSFTLHGDQAAFLESVSRQVLKN